MATTYAISPGSVTVDETAGTVSFTVTRCGALLAETLFFSVTQNHGATTGGDLTFTSGQNSKSITIGILRDSTPEEFGLIVQRNSTDPIAEFLASSTFRIQDNDVVAPSYSISPGSMTLRRFDSEAALATLRRGGCVVVEEFIPQQRIAQLRQEFERLFDTSAPGVDVGVHPPGRMSTICTTTTPMSFFPLIFEVFFDARLKSLAEGYLPGSKVNEKIIATHEQRPGPITSVHFDMMRALKFLVYLSDTDEGNGAFRYALGSHHANADLRERFVTQGGYLADLPNIASPYEEIELVAVVASAGALVAFDTEGFHAGGTMLPDRERRVLRSATYFPNVYSISPPRFSLDWFRRRLGFPRRPPLQVAGRRSSSGNAR